MKKLLLIVLIVSLSGCSSLGRLALKGADISDESLISAEFVICKGASVGSIERRYNTKELLTARRDICKRATTIISLEDNSDEE